MISTTVIPRRDLESLLTSWLPISLQLCDGHPDRRLVLEAIHSVELVADEGLQVTCSGCLCWPLPVLPDRIQIDALTVRVLAHTSNEDGFELSIALEVRDLDLAGIPELVDAGIVDVVQAAIDTQAPTFVWPVSETLSVHEPLPERVLSADAWRIDIPGGDLSITADEIRFSVEGRLGVDHTSCA